jgi:predicted MPP superfamily phosphohydrolase
VSRAVRSVRSFDPSDGQPRHSLIGTGGIASLLRLPGNESLSPEVHDWEVPVPGLPPALDGLKVVLLADLHMAPGYSRRYFDAVADQALALDADLVLCTGDVVEHPDAVTWIEPVLGRIRGRLGQYSILGNHDHQHGAWHIQEALAAAGYVDVEGRWQVQTVPTAAGDAVTIAFGGILAPWGADLERDSVPEADLRILLCHTPDHFGRIARWDAVDLMFSGHNHGGQIRLPVIGPVLMPSRYSRRYDRGFFQAGRLLMYVSQGLGAKHPIRFNCPPELTRLTLRCPVATGPDARSSAVAGVARR